jgi:hypothetical protein
MQICITYFKKAPPPKEKLYTCPTSLFVNHTRCGKTIVRCLPPWRPNSQRCIHWPWRFTTPGSSHFATPSLICRFRLMTNLYYNDSLNLCCSFPRCTSIRPYDISPFIIENPLYVCDTIGLPCSRDGGNGGVSKNGEDKSKQRTMVKR